MRVLNHRLYPLLAIVSLLLGSCASSGRSDGLRDVPVSEITLAEPLVAEAKLSDKVKQLRSDRFTSNRELAAALAELSLVRNELRKVSEANAEANEAAILLDPGDKTSRTYFLTRRALFYKLGAEGKHAASVIRPLLHGSWSDLDKAQILNDLIDGSSRGYPTKENALKALVLRTNAAGPHSLEVAESLCTYSNYCWYPGLGLDPTLCAKLQLPVEAAQVEKSIAETREPSAKIYTEPPAMTTRFHICDPMSEQYAEMFRKRAAQIQEDILGGSSLRLADTLMGLGEQEQLRAIGIYEKHYGTNSPALNPWYQLIALTTKNPELAKLYNKKASIAEGLRQAGTDPLKMTYVCMKGAMPSKERQDRQDTLTKVFKAIGSTGHGRSQIWAKARLCGLGP